METDWSDWLKRYGRPVWVDGMWLFSDGHFARSGVRGDRSGFRPPDDERERLLLVRRYWQERVRRAELDAARLKGVLLGEVFGRWTWPEEYGKCPYPDDGVKALERLLRILRGCRAFLAQVDEQLRGPALAAERAQAEHVSAGQAQAARVQQLVV
jgi:hypothetical protein